ncbi:VOC family protein [Sphingorhabdus sp. IMCC26285]|uniref:VOC family protein n=1 Tax=Sphingorhabdus profundilacus TaxID=2509718 RepID=A0A6I4LW15_9SPHN|nr:VOC family protein [Sphingorhabdus profundilacus]MVZ96320.1 VOC family protein [Sphingorhabdus profundilacus]
MSKALTNGAHHIGLTVPDLDAATDFFCAALGFSEVGGNPDYPSKFVSDGGTLLTLWQAAEPASATPFDRKANIGLHHLALGVADDAALGVIHSRVRAHPGTTIEFAPEPIREGSATRHFICAMPGGIRIEFATPFA